MYVNLSSSYVCDNIYLPPRQLSACSIPSLHFILAVKQLTFICLPDWLQSSREQESSERDVAGCLLDQCWTHPKKR